MIMRNKNPGEEELKKREEAYLLSGSEEEKLKMEKLRRGIPLFEHDCDVCIFLGHFFRSKEIMGIKDIKEKFFDLYVCSSERASDPYNESIIARYSSEEPDYSSFAAHVIAGFVFGDYQSSHPELVEGWKRALAGGYLKWPESRGENLRKCDYCKSVFDEKSSHFCIERYRATHIDPEIT